MMSPSICLWNTWDSFKRYVEVDVHLVKTFFRCQALLWRLPWEMWTATESCEFEVPVKLRDDYEDVVEEARKFVLERAPRQRPANETMALLAAQRTVWILAALSQNTYFFALAALGQFLVAPFSLAVSLMTSGMYFLNLSSGHTVNGIIFKFFPVPDWSVTITNQLVLGLMLLDFVANCIVAFCPLEHGKPKRYPLRKTIKHMVWGTFNSKTYGVVLLLFCRGYSINLAWLLLDAVLGLSVLVTNAVQRTPLAWECMFYNVHRLGHLPFIYEHAHKAHHFLHESMSFDGHIFSGSGFPEDWFLLMMDILLVQGLGIPPPMLSWHMLKFQWFNKKTHQRKECDTVKGEQYHEDHHTFHRSNFGFGHLFFDMFFRTYKSDTQSADYGPANFFVADNKKGSVVLRMTVKQNEDVASQKPDKGTDGSVCDSVKFPLAEFDFLAWQTALLKLWSK
eukprot:CAMPEP_0206531168 /NCGR_PEP_ID=MMETSP0325_2-20121206/3609_1 /ASSEMBLY_ACC=CAM_ASM_000347 /TAXON_ID=2866 /ORGANISM="Crypthecodinium cohnii, Strain Seligo" /LENGTH=449 /DNA_ID=CAMNT_0054027369 /DNA_START=37 /DNA_END=1386 /DNA_ORIENTATION=+